MDIIIIEIKIFFLLNIDFPPTLFKNIYREGICYLIRKESLIMNNLKQKIAKKAYEIYTKRNGSDGDQLTDWLQAEKDVMSKTKVKKRKSTSKKVR